VSDPSAADPPERSPYARPPKDAPTEERSYLVDPSPEDFAPVEAPARSGPAYDSSISTAPAAGSATAPAAGSATATAARIGLPASPVAEPAADDRPRPVQVTTVRRGPRRARLVIKHIDPWTVMKISFVVSLVVLAVCVVAVAIIYAVLGKMGVWTQINTLVNEVSPTTTSKALRNPLSGSRVVGVAAVIGAINVVLMTALSTLGAAIYNLISDLVGGVEVTLTDP
jgi:hypothetical protein